MLAERLLMARPEFGHLLPLVGLPAPPASGGEGSAETAVDASSTLAVVAAPALPAARTAAAVPPPDSSSPAPALTDLALRFEDRIAVLFGAIIDRMVERASSQVMSMSRRSSWTPVREALKAAPPAMRGAVPGVTTLLAADGIDDTDLLGGALAAFAGRFEAETKRGQREAVKLAGGEWAELEADAEQSSAAAWALAATLLIAEARRRFDADLPPEEVGEGRSDASAFAVPPLLVRRVSAVAGGEPDVGPNAEGGAAGPLLSIATGALAQRAAASAGLVVDGWTWDYGEEERATFEPHLDLDGTFSPDPFDFGGFYVGDHNGCRCRAVPHLVPASEVGAGTSEETAP